MDSADRFTRALAAVVVAAALLLGMTSTHAAEPAATVSETVPFGQEWTYRIAELTETRTAAFAQPDLETAGWRTGTAPFHSAPAICAFPWSASQRWPVSTALLARRTIALPAGATNVRVLGTIDNDIEVFWNGASIGAHQDGNCGANGITMPVPGELVRSGGNVLAVRAIDLGVVSFFDVKVTYDRPSDVTPPSITSTVDPEANAAGWNNTDVTVSFTCADDVELATCSPAVVLADDGDHDALTGTATDAAGNVSTTDVRPVRIDTTLPSVVFAGERSYAVDETVSVTCTATDDGSGIASDDCAEVAVQRPAYELAAGTYGVTATAVDVAGNTTTTTAQFTVEAVDAAALGRLVASFSDSSGITAALLAKLDAAATATVDGAEAGALRAFANQVAAQSGKALTPAEADVLLGLVATL